MEPITEPTSASTNLRADLCLLHAPSVFDFRERDDVLFAYLSDSDSVNITSIFEMYPLGFFSIRQKLREAGFETKIVNLAALMLMHPALDVDRLLARLEAPVFGIDLHWMAHCHGSIEVARRVRAIHPEALIIFGGISATYYAQELIRYPCVDVVVQGYDTLAPLTLLMQAVRAGQRDFRRIPNLLYKDQSGAVAASGFTHKPARNYNDVTTSWSDYPARAAASPLIMTLPNTGCAHDCPWCGGSRYAYRRMMGVNRTLIAKDHARITAELRSLADAARHTSIYALQCYSETKDRLHAYLEAVKEMGYQKVFFEQFHLTPPETLKKMAASTSAYIMLSPESHDPVISRLAGRGTYTMAELEAWIPRALDAGIAGIFVWFFIGMPRQTPASVMETVAYCERLMRKFRRARVLPLICPMVPFLDPGSRFFEEPEKHGYRIFHRTLEEHRQAMVDLRWHRRLNYETEWLSRREIEAVTYAAIARLVTLKGEVGVLPPNLCKAVLSMIAETQALLCEVDDCLTQRGALPADLKDTVRAYNRKILAYSSDQIIPAPRPFGGRWFDDFTVPPAMLAQCSAGWAGAPPG
ncbi:MAG: cobalamin-dependent protein [Anaerolineales bacterium]|nr:cobalamin-dependent protein [Anaerolineales bacterium]